MPYEFITEVEHYPFAYNIHTVNEWIPAVGTAGLTGSPALCCVEASAAQLWLSGTCGLLVLVGFTAQHILYLEAHPSLYWL